MLKKFGAIRICFGENKEYRYLISFLMDLPSHKLIQI